MQTIAIGHLVCNMVVYHFWKPIAAFVGYVPYLVYPHLHIITTQIIIYYYNNILYVKLLITFTHHNKLLETNNTI